MLRMCVYEAVKSEHRAVPGFQIIFLCSDSFIQANPAISAPESFVHQLRLLHLIFVSFFFLAFFNYLKQDNCLILKNREINAFFFPFQSPETRFLKSDSENCINVIVQYFLDKQHIVWLRKGLDNHG